MAAIAAAAIGAGAGILGDVMSQSGQQEANRMNMQMMLQNENWQTQMSDTAVQRRKADLLAAGFNPILATGDAASTPSVSQPNMQNPNAAFAGMGQQVSSAMQVASNVQLQEAQAKKLISETPSEQYVQEITNPDGTVEFQVNSKANPHVAGDQAIAESNARIAGINADVNNKTQQTSTQEWMTKIANLDYNTKSALYDSAVRAQTAQNKLDEITANSGAKVMGLDIGGSKIGGGPTGIPGVNMPSMTIPRMNLGTLIEALRLSIGATKGH